DNFHVRVVRPVDRIRAGTSDPAVGRDVGLQLHVGESPHHALTGFLPGDLPVLRPFPQTDTGPQFMTGAAQGAEEATGVGFVGGFGDRGAVVPSDGVGGENDAVGDLWGGGGGFHPRDLLHELPAVVELGLRGLVNVGGHYLERVAGFGEQFAAVARAAG